MELTELRQLYEKQADAELVNRLYAHFDEDARLTCSRAAQVEFLTHTRYIQAYLKPGARILDVGAGTGRYSIYWAERGYSVCALELADANVEAFRHKLHPGLDIQLRQGNAIDLSVYADRSFDVVLMMGPLYHLHSEADRQRCIAEAKRVCKPEGVIFFAFLSNDMIVLTEFLNRPDFFTDTTYDHDTFKVEDFPFVFFTVEEARRILRDGGVRILREVAADGVSELLAAQINALDDAGYAQYLRYHFYACEKPELIGHTNHLLLIGRGE